MDPNQPALQALARVKRRTISAVRSRMLPEGQGGILSSMIGMFFTGRNARDRLWWAGHRGDPTVSAGPGAAITLLRLFRHQFGQRQQPPQRPGIAHPVWRTCAGSVGQTWSFA
jgi:hypothetical protein